jgi:hypothetical protein
MHIVLGYDFLQINLRSPLRITATNPITHLVFASIWHPRGYKQLSKNDRKDNNGVIRYNQIVCDIVLFDSVPGGCWSCKESSSRTPA